VPIIKSAKKKMRQDIKRQKHNQLYINAYKQVINSIKKTKEKSKVVELIKKAYCAIDRAAKKKIIHANKARRMKSNIAKLAAKK